MREFSIKTNARNELIDITFSVAAEIEKIDIKNGVCTVFCPHTTGAITINENADPDVMSDIIMKMNKMIPHREGYSHMEGNSDAHIKSSLFGNSKQIIVKNGKLQLGTWQGIYFCEFDGPRNRNVWVSVTG